jgi:hypothetical protein
MPNTITEGRHAGEFIIDDEVAYSREQIIVLSGQVLEAGHVVGMIALGAANLGKVTVEDPDGVNVGVATVATEFTGGGLTFTIADGSTDFASGDAFTITVAAGSGKVKEYNPANTDGSAVPAGILYDAVDATAADKRGVILARHAVVNAAELVWFSGASANQKATGLAGLALLGIIGR